MILTKIISGLKVVAVLAAAIFGAASLSHASVMLTDSAVFSTNSFGENWNGWIWNTQAPPADSANRWNLYYSSSSDPQNPVFLNALNDSATNINIELTAGTHTFLIFGETVTTTLDPLQHFVLSLYFEGNQAAPDISGLYGPDCMAVCAASHWNGLDLFGNSGLGGNLNAQEAGTLVYASGGYTVSLEKFTWDIALDVDRVWSYWGDTVPYNNGSGVPDFVGVVQLSVNAVPEPGPLSLFALGLLGLCFARRRHHV